MLRFNGFLCLAFVLLSIQFAAAPGQAAQKTNAAAKYDRIIALYRDYVIHRNDDDAYDTLMAKLSHELHIGPNIHGDEKAYQLQCSSFELSFALRANTLGYAFRDLNNDGILELFILLDDLTILAIYSLEKDLPVLVGAYWSRHRCALDKAGMLYISGSSGSQDSFSASYALNGDNKLQLVEMLGIESYDAKTGKTFPKPRHYRMKNGNKSIIGKKEADALWEKFQDVGRNNPTRDAGLTFTPLH